MLTLPPVRPEAVDRVLVAVAAVIWLVFVGISVAAIVAVVDLETGRHGRVQTTDPGAPQLLYLVIAVSGLVIVGAIPLLVRARLAALAVSNTENTSAKTEPAEQRPSPPPAAPSYPPGEGPTEKLRVFGSQADRAERRPPPDQPPQQPQRYAGGLSGKDVERTYLRVVATVASAMGGAMLFVAIGTALMVGDRYVAATVVLSVAAVITALMPVIPWYFKGRLRRQAVAGD